MNWIAKIEAPQSGVRFVHYEGGATVAETLELIRDGYDFERAGSVTISITREGSD